MLCEKYQELPHVEKISFIGQLVHAVQMDNSLFSMANDLIELARMRGLFDGVIILPETNSLTEKTIDDAAHL